MGRSGTTDRLVPVLWLGVGGVWTWGISAGYLASCPSVLGTGWTCLGMGESFLKKYLYNLFTLSMDDNEKLLKGRHTSLNHRCGEVLTSSKDVGNNLELENVMVCFYANIGLHTDLSTHHSN